ncbi:MAG TPA: sensor domain-containing protein [Solirubrobacteraceae bacterium]|nr:sensor domain-containing protein [Solirubrobacteraceae bacterium]
MTAIRAPRGGLELPRHLRAAGRTLLYLLLGIPYGIVYLVLVGGGLLLGAVLSIAWIGLPLIAAVTRLVWQLAEGERRQANRLLEAHLPPVPRAPRGDWRTVLGDTRHGPFWRVLAMLLLKLPVVLAALALAAAPVALAVGLLVLAVEGFGGEADRIVGPWALGPAVALALCVLAFAAAVVSVAAQDGLGRLLRTLAQKLLRSEAAGEGPVRELLAERLGDRSLNIAYWLPDRGIFVNERGHPVDLPTAGSGRTWTAVEHEGNRVAAIVHDAELDATPELVHAAASAAALAIDNERLKADLRARLEELRHSRRRIVEAADDARRQIERDLHDGAQQQLVSLALDLRLLRARLKHEPELADTVQELADKLADALAELRELARGIHPAVLSDHGLAPAIHVLVERAPIKVDCDLQFEDRLPAPIEAAAYFVVAEGLTNVVKYANASRATVSVHRRPGAVEVSVADDGVGGARIDAGSGLRGLSDRLAALEGRIELESPLGEGTRLSAWIPTRNGDEP